MTATIISGGARVDKILALIDATLAESIEASRDAGFYARLMGTTSTSRVSARMGSWS